jgi:hypothetical protein
MNALSWIMSNWQLLLGVMGTVVMGASIAVKAIAPLTKNTADDKAAGWLDKIHGFFSMLALNPPKDK